MNRALVLSLGAWVALGAVLHAAEFHVATNGQDTNPGTLAAPLRTIQHAADLAQPGDTITVHQGEYRERVNPPRGGDSERRRIVYRAAPGERVAIKGSEVVKGWVKVQDNVWKVTLPNSFFGGFNPYSDLIRGDWFDPRRRQHHTGAVYLNGDWLTEAARLEEVLAPASPAWVSGGGSDYLLNVAWLRPVGGGMRVPAASFAGKTGTQNAPCSEGGECVGFILPGHWVRYKQIDFGAKSEQMEIRAASATSGGLIEVRLDEPQGELLGTCSVPNTGGWQSWVTLQARLKPVSGLKSICLVFRAPKPEVGRPPAVNPRLWFAQVDATNTTLWAQFEGLNPNEQLVEINARRSVFYPDQPGRNFITVRGFELRHAATPWAPPTAEQVGLIGTHWSRGWIIESNLISHSVCCGVTLGKHGDQYDNTSADTAEGYVKTIERAQAFSIPWTREHIGHHVVRNNSISHCEQAGIVGSLGAAFCTVSGNDIHDIHVRCLFSGAEMAGIKFHAAIDTTISANHIYRTCRGIWLDWMAQGTRVSGNLFHDNASEDLFTEVDHGPFVVDNNLFLSWRSLFDMSEGGAYFHNLIAGKIFSLPEHGRLTPFHLAHSTTVAGLKDIQGADHRFYNNLFVGNGTAGRESSQADPNHAPRGVSFGLAAYDVRDVPIFTGGNVYYHGAAPHAGEVEPLLCIDAIPAIKLLEEGTHTYLQLTLGKQLKQTPTQPVTTARLGKARIPNLPYENPDGTPLKTDTDYFGQKRSATQPTPGPFEAPETGPLRLKVW